GIDRRLRDRPHLPGDLPPPARRTRAVGAAPRPLDRGPRPRALPDLRLRRRRFHPLLHRIRRSHAEQPRPPGATALPRGGPGPDGPAGGDPYRQVGRHGPRLDAPLRWFLGPDSALNNVDIQAFISPFSRAASA